MLNIKLNVINRIINRIKINNKHTAMIRTHIGDRMSGDWMSGDSMFIDHLFVYRILEVN